MFTLYSAQPLHNFAEMYVYVWTQVSELLILKENRNSYYEMSWPFKY